MKLKGVILFRHLKKYIRQNIWILLLGILCLLVTDVLQTFVPLLIGRCIDKFNSLHVTSKDIFDIVILILFIELLVFLFRFLMRYMLNRSVVNLEFSLRTDYFKHLESLDMEFYTNNKTGDLMARATNDIKSIASLFTDGIITFVDSIFMSIFIIILMFNTIDMRITLLSVSPLLVIAVLTVSGAPLLEKVMYARNVQFGKVSEKSREFFSGIRTVKSYAKEFEVSRIFARESKILYSKNMSVVKIYGLMEPMIRSVSLFTMTLAIYIGGSAVFNDTLTVGSFVALLDYVRKLVWPFMAIGFLVSIVQGGVASIKRVNQVFDYTSSIVNSEKPSELTKLSGNITVNNLSFSHANKIVPTLKHINFDIKKGETVGIVGKTGAGKSTLINLLLRFEDVPNDSIYFDGVDINDIDLKVLRQNISCAMQNSIMFSDSIKSNVLLKKSVNDEEIFKYTKISDIHDEIGKLSDDYYTHIGERGVNISGGQKQRLDIARALYKNSPIVIFDDALSSLDNKTQQKILKNLKDEFKNKTAIIISHRISTVQDADKILVMDDGFLVDVGSHDELINRDGLYKDFYDIQSVEEEMLKLEV